MRNSFLLIAITVLITIGCQSREPIEALKKAKDAANQSNTQAQEQNDDAARILNEFTPDRKTQEKVNAAVEKFNANPDDQKDELDTVEETMND